MKRFKLIKEQGNYYIYQKALCVFGIYFGWWEFETLHYSKEGAEQYIKDKIIEAEQKPKIIGYYP